MAEQFHDPEDPEIKAAIEYQAAQFAGGKDNKVLLGNMEDTIRRNPSEIDKARDAYAAHLRKKAKSGSSGEYHSR